MAAITRNPDVMAGRYCLAGTRMPVTQVKQMIADPDGGREWVKQNFPWITDEQIDAALAFRAGRSPMSHPETVPVEQVDTLLPCPFCGGEANSSGVVRYSKDHEAWFADGTQVREAFFVNCVKCGVSNIGLIGHQTREKAIAAWNTRASHAPSEDAEMVEVDVEDAPIELSLEEAYAWVSGYNAAIRAMQKEGQNG